MDILRPDRVGSKARLTSVVEMILCHFELPLEKLTSLLPDSLSGPLFLEPRRHVGRKPRPHREVTREKIPSGSQSQLPSMSLNDLDIFPSPRYLDDVDSGATLSFWGPTKSKSHEQNTSCDSIGHFACQSCARLGFKPKAVCF